MKYPRRRRHSVDEGSVAFGHPHTPEESLSTISEGEEFIPDAVTRTVPVIVVSENSSIDTDKTPPAEMNNQSSSSNLRQSFPFRGERKSSGIRESIRNHNTSATEGALSVSDKSVDSNWKVQPFNLEIWWTRSTAATRLSLAMVIFCLVISIVYLVASVVYIILALCSEPPSPYECTQLSCQKAAVWLDTTIDHSVKPCDNFYKFVCGNHRHHSRKDIGDKRFDYLNKGGYPVHMGDDSILAKLLAKYGHNNETLDKKAIKFYQACLDLPKREKYGLKGFVETVEEIFGTRDFTRFEQGTDLLEEIGARMFRRVGHASFLNMAFFAYPFIEIQRPHKFACSIYFAKPKYKNAQLVRAIVTGVAQELKVPASSGLIQDMIDGVDVMSHIIHKIRDVFDGDNYFNSTTLEDITAERVFMEKMERHFYRRGLCPPLGMRLNVFTVLRLFLEEDFRLKFADLTAAKHFAAMQLCLSQHPKRFSHKAITHKKTAFVSLWLVEMFYQFLRDMDTVPLMDRWDITPENFPGNPLIEDRHVDYRHEVEYECLASLFHNLGNIPIIQYFFLNDPRELKDYIEDVVAPDTIRQFKKDFLNTAESNMHPALKHLGRIQFSRRSFVHYGMSWVSGVLDKSSVSDNITLTDDHLKNSFEGIKLVIKKARLNWSGATNRNPIIRWFGYGGDFHDVEHDLLDFRQPTIRSAPLREVPGAANGDGQWETFLNRKYPNFILYPATLWAQPHMHTLLSIRVANVEMKIARSFLQWIECQTPPLKYSSLKSIEDLVSVNDSLYNKEMNRECYVLLNERLKMQAEQGWLSSYTHQPERFCKFSLQNMEQFHNIFAMRFGLRWLRRCREELRKQEITWTTPNRKDHMQITLPGKMSKYSEEQIYFIASVHQYCRGSWKTHKYFKDERWLLEMNILQMLTQVREFAEVWNCPKDSFMNNSGLPRCLTD